ncbi:hypothetical protein ABTX81_21090 [Kitasatospora sp. NPDC097605]|uniref:hypothetical protein n=1 Tax=Kitasatospora sp. NPDC097605 TaxID=3157226 RepID=UPI003327DE39
MRRAVIVFVATSVAVLPVLLVSTARRPVQPEGSSAGPPEAQSAGMDLGTAATISAVAGPATSVGISASRIIGAVAELTRSRADLARARREGEAGAPATAPAPAPGAGPDPVPGQDA